MVCSMYNAYIVFKAIRHVLLEGFFKIIGEWMTSVCVHGISYRNTSFIHSYVLMLCRKLKYGLVGDLLSFKTLYLLGWIVETALFDSIFINTSDKAFLKVQKYI